MSMKNIIKKENISLKEELGERLKERRLQLEMTQTDVAEKLGVAQSVYQRFEKGTFECNYCQLRDLCRILDLSSDFLLGLTEY